MKVLCRLLEKHGSPYLKSHAVAWAVFSILAFGVMFWRLGIETTKVYETHKETLTYTKRTEIASPTLPELKPVKSSSNLGRTSNSKNSKVAEVAVQRSRAFVEIPVTETVTKNVPVTRRYWAPKFSAVIYSLILCVPLGLLCVGLGLKLQHWTEKYHEWLNPENTWLTDGLRCQVSVWSAPGALAFFVSSNMIGICRFAKTGFFMLTKHWDYQLDAHAEHSELVARGKVSGRDNCEVAWFEKNA